MAIKQVDLSRLLAQVRASKTFTEDRPLAQVIEQLIQQAQFLTALVSGISGGSSTTNITEIINQYMIMQGGGDGDGDGDIGPPGIQGITGIDGTTGAAGPITVGPMGIDGQDGDDGFPIPGQAGPIGPTGDTGPAGPITIGPMGMDGEDGNDGFPIPGPPGPTGSGSGITILRTTANQTINAGAAVFTDITDLTFPVVSGQRYAFKFYIVFQSAAATTGWKVSVNCPTGTLDFFLTYQTVANSATGGVQTWLQKHSVTRDDMTVLTTTITAGVDLVCMIEGRYLCTADGTFAARFANELVTNTDIVVQEGSWGLYF